MTPTHLMLDPAASVPHRIVYALTIHPIDNVGLNPSLVSASTIESVVAAYPRKQWSCCFADAMNQEMELKPWCHTTANEGFVESVLGNKLMEPYDG